MTEQLYNTAILRLASAIPHEGRLPAPAVPALKVSPICGSRVTAFVELDPVGRVARFAQEVRACALGQASAAMLGAGVIGRTPGELAEARDALAAYLRGDGPPPPGFPDTTLFEPARPFKARHASIRLAFEAAAEAAAQAHAAARLQAA
ncbi:MAG: iron-sulfur cluster assembly scaffold protein [Sphingomonadaceae bacterium]|nr:iron-sulfur cluster assembly scaffold protein [Sphingomonadaceae bacterium]